MDAMLVSRGWQVVSGTAGDPLVAIVRAFAAVGVTVQRDVVVATAGSPGDLQAEPGDFWFHTDGVFWQVPPRWMCVQLVRAETGGRLHALDLRPLAEQFTETAPVWFGTPHSGTMQRIAQRQDDTWLMRYRRDYMHALDAASNAALTTLHAQLAEHAARASEVVGTLQPGDCLVMDNWRVAHRREAFVGMRIIRRLWLGNAQDAHVQ